jgi:hypothetical protein
MDQNVNESIQKKIKKRILDKTDYSFHSMEQYELKLDNKIVLYNNGSRWRVIPIRICLSYPVIYETYSHEDEQYDVTIVVCPITLRCVMLKGKFKFNSYDGYRMILEGDNDLMPIDVNYKINDKLVVQENRRMEVKIVNLRTAVTSATDAEYMKCDKKVSPIIKISYYLNKKDIYKNPLPQGNIHPKTLVYIVRYESISAKKERYVILLGRDANNDKISGYDVTKSGLNNHLIKHRSKIINKDGYVMPMLWYLAKEVYKDARVILLV